MSAKRYTEKFKIYAVKQVTKRGHAVVDFLGGSTSVAKVCVSGLRNTACQLLRETLSMSLNSN